MELIYLFGRCIHQ